MTLETELHFICNFVKCIVCALHVMYVCVCEDLQTHMHVCMREYNSDSPNVFLRIEFYSGIPSRITYRPKWALNVNIVCPRRYASPSSTQQFSRFATQIFEPFFVNRFLQNHREIYTPVCSARSKGRKREETDPICLRNCFPRICIDAKYSECIVHSRIIIDKYSERGLLRRFAWNAYI